MNGEDVRNIEGLRCTRDGNVQNVLITLSALKNESGEIDGGRRLNRLRYNPEQNNALVNEAPFGHKRLFHSVLIQQNTVSLNSTVEYRVDQGVHHEKSEYCFSSCIAGPGLPACLRRTQTKRI